ncbi:hypothetical protein HN51_041386, partial [Arachis hypogaea]
SEFQHHRRNPQPTSLLHRISVVRALRSAVPHGLTLSLPSPRRHSHSRPHVIITLSLGLTSSSLSVGGSGGRQKRQKAFINEASLPLLPRVSWVVVVVIRKLRKCSSRSISASMPLLSRGCLLLVAVLVELLL